MRHDNKVGAFGLPLPPTPCNLLERETHAGCDGLSLRHTEVPITVSLLGPLETLSQSADPPEPPLSDLQMGTMASSAT